MSKGQRRLILSVAALMIGAFPVMAADFYETQLRLGAEAYRTGRLPDAIDYLRVANFGLLDRPPLLVEGLARLTLAQHASGLQVDVRKTIERFVAVERQFPSWSAAVMESELRQQFETLLRETLSAEALRSLPSLAPPEAAKSPGASMTPDQQRRQWESKARSEPYNATWPLLIAKDDANKGDERGALRWSEKALDINDGLVEARVLRVSLFTARKDYRRASEELARLPSSAWFDYPDVNADAFVLFTNANDFVSADQLYDRIPPHLASRGDVAEAMAAFRVREASRLEEQAMRELPEDAAELDSDEPVPDAAPVQGPEEPVDARMNAPRGSFTNPADPVADALATSKRLIRDGRPEDAQLVLRDTLRKEPASRELRLAMLEASCLASDWRTGVSQLLLIEPFRPGEEKYMFYGSVVYHESERPDAAKPLMAAALPKLARTPYVDHYARLVMGE